MMNIKQCPCGEIPEVIQLDNGKWVHHKNAQCEWNTEAEARGDLNNHERWEKAEAYWSSPTFND